MIEHRCKDCWGDEARWSNHFAAYLCDDCFDRRCYEDGEPITLQDIEDINDQIVNFESLQ